MEKIYYSWADVTEAVDNLAGQLYQADWKPDYIVGLSRGGVTPAVILSHRLGVPMRSLEVSLRDGGRKMIDFEICADALSGDRILVVDDINDSGETIRWIKKSWGRTGDRWDNVWHNSVRFATLTNNAASIEKVDYSFWQVDKSKEDCWLVFPWEGER